MSFFFFFPQQDAHELLSEMLDRIHEEVVELRKGEDKTEEENEESSNDENDDNTLSTNAKYLACGEKSKENNSQEVVLSPIDKNFTFYFKSHFEFKE